jgi:hypothetical protein
MSIAQGQPSFRVGDRINVRFGPRKLTGVIVEDRGAIGAQGRHLFQVNIPMEPFEPMMLELPEDELEAADRTDGAVPIDKDKITDYLTNGGLVSILRSNLSGGRYQTRAWLCLDNLGNVTHTFVPERGMIGGELVPWGAVHDDKIFRPTRDSVLSLIQSFGLTRDEAEKIVSKIGTAPL